MSSIEEMVESGKYFSNALDWHAKMYIYPITERAWAQVMTCAAVLLFIISWLNVYSMFPLKSNYPFVKWSTFTEEDDALSSLKKIDDNIKDNPQHSVSKYLIGKYVENYESYDFHNMETRRNFIKENSSREVNEIYIDRLSTSNPDSLVLKYKKDIKRRVYVTNVRLTGFRKTIPSMAEVEYQVINEGSGQRVANIEKVSIEFILSDIYRLSKNNLPLEFVVQNYNK